VATSPILVSLIWLATCLLSNSIQFDGIAGWRDNLISAHRALLLCRHSM
jgi:hypothetical protein